MQSKLTTAILLTSVFLMSIIPDPALASVRIQIIDRGQADGILVRTPNNHWIVIDAGTNGQQANAMENDWGVDKVDLAIVTIRRDTIEFTLPVDRTLAWRPGGETWLGAG